MSGEKPAITRYTALSRWLHWGMAILIVGMVFVGAAMVGSVAAWQPVAVQWHKWLGLALLALVALRLVQRLRHPAPPLPSDLPRLQAISARAAHVALYALMIAMPLIGWAMQGAAGTPIVLPGGWVLPAIVTPDLATYGLLRDAHAVLAYTLFALVLLHAGAGLYHGLVRQDGVLASMTGGAVPTGPTTDEVVHAERVEDALPTPQDGPSVPEAERREAD